MKEPPVDSFSLILVQIDKESFASQIKQKVLQTSGILTDLNHRDRIHRGRKGHKNQFLAYV